MPMRLLTLLQFMQIFVSYILVAVILPAWVFHRKLSGFSFSFRILFYFVTGNFFVVNLVLILQLIHISNRLTLMLFTVGAAGAIGVKNNGLKPLRFLKNQWGTVELILDGRLGVRTMLLKLRKSIGRSVSGYFRTAWYFIRSRILDLCLLAGVTDLFFWRFGRQLLHAYAYCASDIIVHNYWINALGEGKLFVHGVYPFGFHCVMYYLHEMFGIDNYVLLRIFWFIQTLMVFYSLIFFLKECCKNRYLPYLGMLLYVSGTFGVLGNSTYWRFFSSLPQEFGMIFILPSIQFLFAFFRIRKEEVSLQTQMGEKKKGRHVWRFDEDLSLWCLAGFAMSCSLTLAVHFYNTMIVGLLCIGGVVGYGFRLFRKKYLGRVIISGIIGVLAAVLPMAAAFAMGTPLQGSLQWGMSIIEGSSKETETETGEMETARPLDTQGAAEQEPSSQLPSQESGSGGSAQTPENPGDTSESFIMRITHGILKFFSHVNECVAIRLYVIINGKYQQYAKYLIRIFYGLPCLGFIFFCLKKTRDYGARILSAGSGLWLLGILLAADYLGLPALMDLNRASIYTTMVLIAGIVLLVDGVLYGITCFIKINAIRQAPAFPIIAAVVWTGFHTGIFYEVPLVTMYGSNEAVLCLTNIIRQFEDKTWTICSANDELRMADDHGYHYELTDFLGKMEHLNKKSTIQIPSPYAFFFIEKIPIDYSNAYEGSGQKISKEGASRNLPAFGGIRPYQGENRWIMMSRMYYWAQEFKRLYPNEFKVYFENENFVCYYVEQNTYALYNFAIDYGYNGRNRKKVIADSVSES